MASFDFLSCRIDVSDIGSGADLANMPADTGMTMSFSHEYIHFLQLISSNAGFRILAELVDFGVHSALQLSGIIGPDGGHVWQYYDILPKLAALPDHEGSKHADIRARVQDFLDEVYLQFQPLDHAYTGAKGPWEIDRQTVTYGTYTEPMHGFVVAGPRFRPFTPGFLAENMARCVDQWLKKNMGYDAHKWTSSVVEAEFYNGLRHILARQRYHHNVFPGTLDRIAVMICTLALVTPRPDLAVVQMLLRLEDEQTAGGLAATVGETLRELLMAKRLLHAAHYNSLMTGVMHGPARIMNRVEYMGIHDQLKCIHRAGRKALDWPGFLADEDITWDGIRALMAEHTVPPVIAADGDVQEIAGLPCVSNVTHFLDLVTKKLFPQ